MRRVLVGPENAHQSMLLTLLRDLGPVSRAELGEAVRLSRSKLAVELDRLAEIGLIEPRGSPPRAAAADPRSSSSPGACASSASTSARPGSTWRSPTRS